MRSWKTMMNGSHLSGRISICNIFCIYFVYTYIDSDINPYYEKQLIVWLYSQKLGKELTTGLENWCQFRKPYQYIFEMRRVWRYLSIIECLPYKVNLIHRMLSRISWTIWPVFWTSVHIFLQLPWCWLSKHNYKLAMQNWVGALHGLNNVEFPLQGSSCCLHC